MPASVIYVMGVSGSGKSTIAQNVALKLKCAFKDGDSLHPQSNIDKMTAGHALTDDVTPCLGEAPELTSRQDRLPWLEAIRDYANSTLEQSKDDLIIIACSALKKSYRDLLRATPHDVYFIYRAWLRV
jgi:gluconokinase